MIEVIIKCESCEQDFVQVALTDTEIKEIQKTIWHKTLCAECEKNQRPNWCDWEC